MSRPSFDTICMHTAELWAERSPDTKTQVGAVIVTVDDYKVRGVGYNGPPRNLSNERYSGRSGQSGFIHAEINALLNSDLNPAIRHIMYVTHEPCYHCAAAIINKGCITCVVFKYEHYSSNSRDVSTMSGLALLMDAGILVYWYGMREGETVSSAHRIESITEYSPAKSKRNKPRRRR